MCTHQALAQMIEQVGIVTIPYKDSEVCSPSTDRVQIARENLKALINQSLTKEQCGPGFWFRAAYLNMSNPSQSCPGSWREYNTNGVRACGRSAAQESGGCSSVWYHSYRGQYSKICGRVIGYQVMTPDAFTAISSTTRSSNLNNAYVDGVSVTYGTPRTHIWTFAAGITEGTTAFPEADCPCALCTACVNRRGRPAPAFIEDHFYCESGNSASTYPGRNLLLTSDPLWDGQNCEGQCCGNGKSPPWFNVTLPMPTTAGIEVRICGDQSGLTDEDTPVALIELYVQ